MYDVGDQLLKNIHVLWHVIARMDAGLAANDSAYAGDPARLGLMHELACLVENSKELMSLDDEICQTAGCTHDTNAQVN